MKPCMTYTFYKANNVMTMNGGNMKTVYDIEFKKYGKVLTGYDFSELMEAMKDTPLPDDVIYVADDVSLNCIKAAGELSEAFFGQMPVQTGYCNGHNAANEYMEYHRCSEINVAVTDMVLELGLLQDVSPDFKCNPTLFEKFLVPGGTAVEMYATTLHYAPINADEDGFKCVVVLPKGTNEALGKKIIKTKEDKILEAKNKWLIKL